MADNDPPRRDIPLTGAPGTPTSTSASLPVTTSSQASTSPSAAVPSTSAPSMSSAPGQVTPPNAIASAAPAASTGPARTVASDTQRLAAAPAPGDVPVSVSTVPQVGSVVAQTQDGSFPTPTTATVPSTETPPTTVSSSESTTSGNAQQLPSGPARTRPRAPTDAEFESILAATIDADPEAVRNLTDGSLPAEDIDRIRQEANDTLARTQAMGVSDTGVPLTPQSVLATPAMLPHKFAESQYAVYHHDVIVYIQGVDVSDWVTGTVTITNNVGADPNTCELTLDNAMNRFVLTPENITGVWRTSTDYAHADYDESAKKRIYEIKAPLGNNPVDRESGARMWPLDLWSPIFHKGDPIRVWIRNPLNPEADEYMPMFTGYVHHFEKSTNYVSRESSITISCQDIRYIMRQMLTNENTVLFVQPGESLTSNSSAYSSETSANTIDLSAGGGAFSRNFFQNLVVSSNTYANPWANVSLFKLIKALTFAGPGEAQAIVDAASEDARNSLDQQIRDAERTLNSSTTNATNRAQREAHLTALRRQRDQEQARRSGQSATPQQTASESANQSTDSGRSQSTQASTSNQQPVSQPTQEDAPAAPQSPAQVQAARSEGKGQIGRIRRGFDHRFPSTTQLPDSTAEDVEAAEPGVNTSDPAATAGSGNGSANSDQATQQAGVVVDGSGLMAQWTSVVMFGLPDWTPRGDSDNQGVPLDREITKDAGTAKYWTLAQVKRTGEHTRSNRACAPDTQLVHILRPGGGTAGDAIIQDNNYAVSDTVNVQRQWVSRLDLISKACETVDYKFYVSPSGDLVFEFPQYDFYPSDYNVTANVGWQPVYEFDYDLIDDRYNPEAGEIVNCVIVTGSLTGYTDFIDTPGNAVQELDPEAFPHAIAYCPILTMRHGVNIHTISLPLITDREKLKRIAVLMFQRLLAQASTYDMSVGYRPWIGLNRPVVNKEFTRYALTESVTHVIGVREHAGPATTSLTLAYPKNVDQFGVPRFLTGGHSMPVYFGVIPGTRDSIMDRLKSYADMQRQRIEEFATPSGAMVVPESTYHDLERYGAPIPYGYDVWNVVEAASGVTTLTASGTVSESTITELARQLMAVDANITSIQHNRSIGQMTASEAADAIAAEDRRAQEIQNRLQTLGHAPMDAHTAEAYAAVGIRTQDTVGTERAESLPEVPEDQLCDLDQYPNSSPLGRQPNQPWPRKIVREFSSARADNHEGVDYAAVDNERVYCVRDGYVEDVGEESAFGPFVRVMHPGTGSDGGYASVYAPVSATVAKGDSVFRNAVLGTVKPGGPEASENGTVLHFAFATVDGTTGTNKRFVPPQRFPVDTQPLPNFRKLEEIFYDPRPIGAKERPEIRERYHGGFDISWGSEARIEGRNIYSTTPGYVHKVHRVGDNDASTQETGNAVFIRDAAGGVHGYLHMLHPPTLVSGAEVSVGTVLGQVGSTGRSGGAHLHYQIDVGGVYGLRVDVSARLAALAAGMACVSEISIYEAQHTFMVKQRDLVAKPIRVPSNAPATPVAGLTIDEIWRRASRGAVTRASHAPATVEVTPSYTYFNSAVPPPDHFSVPYSAAPSNLQNPEQLRYAILGDSTASTAQASLRDQLRRLLGNPYLDIADKGIRATTLAQWLEPETAARARRVTAQRHANTTTLREVAHAYDVVLVSFVSTAATDFTVERVVAITRELSALGATVLWLTHKPLPDRMVVTGHQTIGQLVSAGTPRDQVDSHTRARAQLLAASVTVLDIEGGAEPTAIPLSGGNSGYSSNGILNAQGKAFEAGILGPLIVGKLNEFRQAGVSSGVSTAPMFSDAVPPEDCPPDRQRIRRAPVTAPAPESSEAPVMQEDDGPPVASTRPIRIYGGMYAANAGIATTLATLTQREVVPVGIPGADIAAWTAAITPTDAFDALVIEFGDVRVPTVAEIDAADRALKAAGAAHVVWVSMSWDSSAPVSVRTPRRQANAAVVVASVGRTHPRSLLRSQGHLESDYVRLTAEGAQTLAERVQPDLSFT